MASNNNPTLPNPSYVKRRTMKHGAEHTGPSEAFYMPSLLRMTNFRSSKSYEHSLEAPQKAAGTASELRLWSIKTPSWLDSEKSAIREGIKAIGSESIIMALSTSASIEVCFRKAMENRLYGVSQECDLFFPHSRAAGFDGKSFVAVLVLEPECIMPIVEPSESSGTTKGPSQGPQYPYCMLRTYLCGHPLEIIEVSKHSNRTVHRLLNELPEYGGQKPLTFSLARCKICAEKLKPQQCVKDIVKSQGHAQIETIFKEGGRDRNGFRDVLWRYRNTNSRDYGVILMDGYHDHGRVPEELNRNEEQITIGRSNAAGQCRSPVNSYQRALRLREDEELPEKVQQTQGSSPQGHGRKNADLPRLAIAIPESPTHQPPDYMVAQGDIPGRPSREHGQSIENRRRDLDEVYGNRGNRRPEKPEHDKYAGDTHMRPESAEKVIIDQASHGRRRVLQGLSDLYAPELQIKGSNWNLANITHWNDSATGIPDIEEDFEPANDPEIGVNDSLSMVAAPKRAPRQSVDSLQSALSRSDRTSDSVRSPKVLRFSDEILEQEKQKEKYPSIPRAERRRGNSLSESTPHERSKKLQVTTKSLSVKEAERQRAEELHMQERMASLGQMGAVPRTIHSPPKSPPKARKHAKSTSPTSSSFTDEELDKAKRWHLDERLASLGQMGAPLRSTRDLKDHKRSDSIQSKGSKSSTDSGSKFRIGRRNTIGNGLWWFKRGSKDKGKNKGVDIAEDEANDADQP